MSTITVKELAEYIGSHAYRESILMTPEPQWLVNAHLLLDWIHELTGVSKQQIGEWANAAADRTQTYYEEET